MAGGAARRADTDRDSNPRRGASGETLSEPELSAEKPRSNLACSPPDEPERWTFRSVGAPSASSTNW